MKATLKNLWYGDDGQDLTEYALLLVLIGLVTIVAMKGVASTLSNVYSNAATNVVTATT